MAVEDKYIDALIAAAKKTSAAYNDGAKTVTVIQTFEVAAADDNESVYRVAKAINPDLIPKRFLIYNDAITVGTDYDLGLYETTGEDGVLGPVIDIDVFVNGASMASARARGSGLDGLTAVAIADIKKTLWELAGHTQETKKVGYDIAFTGRVVGSAAGTIAILMEFVQG